MCSITTGPQNQFLHQPYLKHTWNRKGDKGGRISQEDHSIALLAHGRLCPAASHYLNGGSQAPTSAVAVHGQEGRRPEVGGRWPRVPSHRPAARPQGGCLQVQPAGQGLRQPGPAAWPSGGAVLSGREARQTPTSEMPPPRAGRAWCRGRPRAPSRPTVRVTWSAPGWSPCSPRERRWLSGPRVPRAGAPPACSGMPTETGLGPWSVTAPVFSSSSRGDSWGRAFLREAHARPASGAAYQRALRVCAGPADSQGQHSMSVRVPETSSRSSCCPLATLTNEDTRGGTEDDEHGAPHRPGLTWAGD